MAHRQIIQAGDAPQHLAVMHSDGSLSEVQVSVSDADALVVTIEPSRERAHVVIVDGREVSIQTAGGLVAHE